MQCIKCKADLPNGATYCMLCGKKQTPEKRKRRKRANGSGSVYKLSGNRAKPWAASRNGVYLGSFKTYAAATKALERITDVDVTEKYNLTFHQIYDLWKPVHAREVTPGQMGCYTAAFNNCPELHEKKFRSLRKSDFQAVIIKLETANKSKSTCEKVLQLFGQLSKWAMDEGIVQQNHSQNVTTTAQQKNIRQAFTAAQIEAIKKSKHPAADIALILIGTGARPNELFNVPLSSCYDNYFISGSKTEAGQNRVIPVAPIGQDAYRKLRQKAIEKGYTRLIDAYAGNRTVANFTKRDFKKLMLELGIEGMDTYSFRHTFVTLAVDANVPQAKLRQIVGHVDQQTTDRYTHMDAQALVEAVSQITA